MKLVPAGSKAPFFGAFFDGAACKRFPYRVWELEQSDPFCSRYSMCGYTHYSVAHSWANCANGCVTGAMEVRKQEEGIMQL